MPQPLAPGQHAGTAPRFYVTPRQRLRPGPILLATLVSLAALLAVNYTLAHSRQAHAALNPFGQNGLAENDDDDPSRVDTIYLGAPDEAPVATRPASHPSAVHPFVVVHLPRSGDQFGQIPDTPAGHLLYNWLAIFNSKDPSAAAKALPIPESAAAKAAQVQLRKQTGGFTLISAKEVQPGLLVFRLHDQTPDAAEVLGTLQMRPNTTPPTIASFSLRAIPQPQPKVP